MPCEAPIRAYPAAEGGRVKFFTRRDRQYWAEPYNGLQVPCGTCILCREEQARQWAVRITHEATLHPDNSFVTLTYDEAHRPENGSLDYSHLRDFWKRLRYHFGTLSYYAVGEYGDKTNRPHYHACIFGQAFVQDRIIIKREPNLLWTSPHLANAWGLGMVSVGALTIESARYTANYVTKKLGAKARYQGIAEETGEFIPLEQPRPFMSRNIARRWWDTWNQGVIDHDRVVIAGQPQKPPKIYDRWLSEKNLSQIQEIKKKREEKAKKNQKSKEKMRARARFAHARAGIKRKNKSV